jgi:hypothetical protein
MSARIPFDLELEFPIDDRVLDAEQIPQRHVYLRMLTSALRC